MEPTLIFDGVWKKFRRGQAHDTLRDLLPAIARTLTGRKRPDFDRRDFWALSDLSFEVKAGEVLGIIGTNGAGKSTTLKILNQLMEPTRGQVITRGKIGSLIEVSAGFHQDLTGRQNVFLQGAIMGMRKAEVVRKFDQIVDFAGIGEFIDTPVKRYSSGMNARLGFSIAAHLEPEILIIDEVLAVGDHAFQQRAFGKIKGMATGGIPVVLVSHQLDRIKELCTKVILLEKGQVKTTGSAVHCINAYLHPEHSEQSIEQLNTTGIRFDGIRSVNGSAIHSGEDMGIVVTGESLKASYPGDWQLALRVIDTDTGECVHSVLGAQRNVDIPRLQHFEFRVDLQMNLVAGNYFVEMVVWDADRSESVVAGPRLPVQVIDSERFYGTAQLNSRWRDVSRTAAHAQEPVFRALIAS